ncbi:MAG TPA: hypothetical protein VHV51_22615 [Polyangiaceae bacterium]|jgi:type IV pilus assembly protein PilB|nr:hypothetical protein [Polyangiaceae bacterium]
MVPARVRLGELLVEAQIISRAQLEEVLASQKRDGRRIGTLLIEVGLVTETQVTQILSQQLSVPWVSLYHIDFSRQLLNLVSHQLAERYCLVPIFVRRVRGLGETLYVAMDDPSDEVAQREVSQWAGLPVRAMIAPPTDIRSAIRVYYGVGKDTASLSEAVAEVDAETAAGVRSQERAKSSMPPKLSDAVPPSSESTPIPGSMHVLSPREAPPVTVASVKPVPLQAARASAAPAPAAEASAELALVAQNGSSAPVSASSPIALSSRMAASPEVATASASIGGAHISEAPDSGPTIEAREISMPMPRKGGGKMITLTLLDGSKVNLPAREAARRRAGGKRRSLPPTNAEGGELTARDLIAALRAVSHGADATEILGDNVHWEALFAALLSLLLKKHLIADWEFVEEYKKI